MGARYCRHRQGPWRVAAIARSPTVGDRGHCPRCEWVAGYHASHGCRAASGRRHSPSPGSCRPTTDARTRAPRATGRHRSGVDGPRPVRGGAAGPEHGRPPGDPRQRPLRQATVDDPEGPPFGRHPTWSGRRRGGGWSSSLVLRFWTTLGPVARRGPDRQHRPAAPPRDPLLPAAGRRAAALLRPAPLLDGLVRHLGRGRPVAVGRLRGDHPAAGLAGRQAARRDDGWRWAAMLLRGHVAVRHPLRHRDPDVLAGGAAHRARLPGPRPLAAPSPARQPDRRGRGHRAAALHPLLVALPDRHGVVVAGLWRRGGAGRPGGRGPGPRWWPWWSGA